MLNNNLYNFFSPKYLEFRNIYITFATVNKKQNK